MMLSWYVCMFYVMYDLQERNIAIWDVRCFFRSQCSDGESSVWIMTPWAECLFTVPQKNTNLKKAKWRTACFSPRVFEGWQSVTIHTCWEWRTDQGSNMCCGWKIYLEGACVLNWIRKLRERKHKQTGIYISLKLRTGIHNVAPCRDLLF